MPDSAKWTASAADTQKWASMVARINNLQENQLEDFLFGVERISSGRSEGLWRYRTKPVLLRDRIPEPNREKWITFSVVALSGQCIENLVVATSAATMINGTSLRRQIMSSTGRAGSLRSRLPHRPVGARQCHRVGKRSRKNKGRCQSLIPSITLGCETLEQWKNFVHPDFARLHAALCD